jgi:hypothetical protein
MQALSPDSKVAGQGLFYLRHQAQQKGGGFPLGGNGAVNTMSTAWAIQGILAVGGDPDSFRRGSVSAPEYLAHNQREDGSYRYSNPDQSASEVANQTPVWVTGEVLVAAAGKYFPIAAPPRAPKPKEPKANTTSSSSGGIPPSLSGASPSFPPGTVPPGLEKALKGAVGDLPSGHPAPSGKGGSGAKPNGPSTGGRVPEGDLGSALPETSASQAEGEPASEPTKDSGSSTAGAVLLGLLAGCVLFGAGLAGRAGWMRWRYGL